MAKFLTTKQKQRKLWNHILNTDNQVKILPIIKIDLKDTNFMKKIIHIPLAINFTGDNSGELLGG